MDAVYRTVQRNEWKIGNSAFEINDDFSLPPHRSGDIEWMNKMQVIVAVNPGPSWIAVKGGQVSPGSNVGLGVENLGRAGRRLTNSLELRALLI